MATHFSNRWTPKAARNWYRKLPWLVGCNYLPRTAINQLEMWQADTFDPQTIDQELGWAATLGMNSVRVFLHDLVWQQDGKAFVARVERFLEIASRHGIGVMFVIFDSCWHPFPHLGKQPEPEPGVHNSGWLQSPGVAVLRNEKKFDALGKYVTSVVRHFRDDDRIHAWDVWNEPDNHNGTSRGVRDLADKPERVTRLLPKVFEWARLAGPSQPLTAGIWQGDWSCDSSLKPWERVYIAQSDVVSFHCYGTPDSMQAKVAQLSRYERPIFCTEYMARGVGSTFGGILPILKEHRVAAYNWGFVQGRSQTNLPWDSWQFPYTEAEPKPWFHDIFRPDGSAYDKSETALLRRMTGAGNPQSKLRK
jgi:hypothetical protein